MSISFIQKIIVSLFVLASYSANAALKTASLNFDNTVTHLITDTDHLGSIPPFSIHQYQPGDKAVFSGSLTLSKKNGSESTSAIKVIKTLLASKLNYQGKEVLTERTITTFIETDKQQTSIRNIWQEPDGSLFELSNEYGNEYVISNAFDKGLPEVQVGFDKRDVHFFTLYRKQPSGPVTEGNRLITIAPIEIIKTPLGEYQAYHLIHKDSYTYLFTYVDNQKGTTVVSDRDIWISPEKGVIKKIEIRRGYSRSGELQSKTRLELTIDDTNF